MQAHKAVQEEKVHKQAEIQNTILLLCLSPPHSNELSSGGIEGSSILFFSRPLCEDS